MVTNNSESLPLTILPIEKCNDGEHCDEDEIGVTGGGRRGMVDEMDETGRHSTEPRGEE